MPFLTSIISAIREIGTGRTILELIGGRGKHYHAAAARRRRQDRRDRLRASVARQPWAEEGDGEEDLVDRMGYEGDAESEEEGPDKKQEVCIKLRALMQEREGWVALLNVVLEEEREAVEEIRVLEILERRERVDEWRYDSAVSVLVDATCAMRWDVRMHQARRRQAG